MKKKNRICTILFSLFFLTSCFPVYQITSSEQPQIHYIKQGASILVLTAEDGYYGSDVYKGSGLKLSRKVQAAFNYYQCNAQIDLDHSKFKELAGKDLSQYHYIVVPIITHWEDRATAWSDMPDRLSYSLFFYKNDGSSLMSVDVEAKSAIIVLSNDPSDLIDPTLNKYLSSIIKQ